MFYTITNLNSQNCLLLIIFLLTAKYHIFTSKIAETNSSMQVFLALLDDKIQIEEATATKNNRIAQFKVNWKSLSQSF